MTAVTAPEIRIFPGREELSRSAAELFVTLARERIAAAGRFSAALSGGSTPVGFYQLLGSDPWRARIEWEKVHLFWADERAVPPDHRESNYRLASEAFLSHVPIPKENIHSIRAEGSLDRAAGAYERELCTFFGDGEVRFDLIILGVGEDGHTASLFSRSGALAETSRLAVHLSRPAPGPDRVTLTITALNRAAMIVFLASGRRKAGVIREIIDEGNPKGHPAGLVKPLRGNVVWLLDGEAASELRRP